MGNLKIPPVHSKRIKSNKKSKQWKELMKQTDKPTEWAEVGMAALTSMVMTAFWMIFGAEIILFSTMISKNDALKDSDIKTKASAVLDYYFPSDIYDWPYFLPKKEQKNPFNGNVDKWPFNGWRWNPKRDGIRGPWIGERVVKFLFGELNTMAENEALAQLQGGTKSESMEGGAPHNVGDLFTCGTGNVHIPEEQSTKSAWPYNYAASPNMCYPPGWGTGNPLSALGFIAGQLFTTGRGIIKGLFENLRPIVANGSRTTKSCIILTSGLWMFLSYFACMFAYSIVTLWVTISTLIGANTNYVGPGLNQVYRMSRGSRFIYWSSWYASYFCSLAWGFLGGPMMSGVMMLKLAYDIILQPILDGNLRARILDIITCHSSLIMVIFGALFLFSTILVTNPLTWLGMGGVYGLALIYTIYKEYTNE